jgi:hypothetical protein
MKPNQTASHDDLAKQGVLYLKNFGMRISDWRIINDRGQVTEIREKMLYSNNLSFQGSPSPAVRDQGKLRDREISY